MQVLPKRYKGVGDESSVRWPTSIEPIGRYICSSACSTLISSNFIILRIQPNKIIFLVHLSLITHQRESGCPDKMLMDRQLETRAMEIGLAKNYYYGLKSPSMYLSIVSYSLVILRPFRCQSSESYHAPRHQSLRELRCLPHENVSPSGNPEANDHAYPQQ